LETIEEELCLKVLMEQEEVLHDEEKEMFLQLQLEGLGEVFGRY
jgi:hypothetical protein